MDSIRILGFRCFQADPLLGNQLSIRNQKMARLREIRHDGNSWILVHIWRLGNYYQHYHVLSYDQGCGKG